MSLLLLASRGYAFDLASYAKFVHSNGPLYEMQGTVFRESVNGHPTSTFQNSQLRIFHSCGGYELQDSNSNIDIYFPDLDCTGGDGVVDRSK